MQSVYFMSKMFTILKLSQLTPLKLTKNHKLNIIGFQSTIISWYIKNHTHVKKVGHISEFLFGIY